VVFIRILGKLHYLWRAADQNGAVLDILVQQQRVTDAPKVSFGNCSQAGPKSRE
jgi:putative transposase